MSDEPTESEGQPEPTQEPSVPAAEPVKAAPAPVEEPDIRSNMRLLESINAGEGDCDRKGDWEPAAKKAPPAKKEPVDGDAQ